MGADPTACRADRQFGSGRPGNPAQVGAYNFLRDEQIEQVENFGGQVPVGHRNPTHLTALLPRGV